MLLDKIPFFFICSCVVASTSWAGPGCIRVKEASVRIFKNESESPKSKKNSPKKDREEIRKLPQYTPVYWAGEKVSGRLKVNNMNGEVFLVRQKDVSFRMRCVSVVVGKSRLRSGPGSQFEKAMTVSKGSSFLDLGSEDGWIQVRNEKGEEAWLNLDHSWRPTNKMKMKFEVERIGTDQ